MPKPTITPRDMETLMIGQLRDLPACEGVTGVTITSDAAGSWHVAGLARDGRRSAPACWEAARRALAELLQQFDVVALGKD